MSRSGYSDDLDQWVLIRYRGAVASAIRGQRGQAFLQALRIALDAMPNKRLIKDELVTSEGEYCALGVIGAAKGLPLTLLDPYDHETLANKLDIADSLVREVAFINDESWYELTSDARWQRVSSWVNKNLEESS